MKVHRAGHIRGDFSAAPHTQRTAATPRPRVNYTDQIHADNVIKAACCPLCGKHMLDCDGHGDIPDDELTADYLKRDWSFDKLYPHKKAKA